MSMEIKKCNPKYHPPDGGWGWIIVIAYGLANILLIPVLHCFGLIFKDKFHEMNITATQFSFIINISSSFTMSVGLINGPLLKFFGYRKIAVFAGFLFSFGLFLTSFSNSFIHFIITYSIITSIGTGLSTSSFSLALNTYFKKHRNKAFGIAMTITGFGPILIPQLVSFLLILYKSQGCLMIISSLTLHIIVAALLLQPLKWHSQKILNEFNNEVNEKLIIQNITDSIMEVDENSESSKKIDKIPSTNTTNTPWELSSEEESDYLDYSMPFLSLDHQIYEQSIYGLDLYTQMRSFKTNQSNEIKSDDINKRKSRAMSLIPEQEIELPKPLQPKIKRWFESGSSSTVNLGSSYKIFDINNIKNNENFINKSKSLNELNKENKMETSLKISYNGRIKKTNEKNSNNFKNKLIKLFDLDLLNDKIYLNILIGLALAIFSEINFSLLTPIILDDMGYGTSEIAGFMSTLAGSDIIIRFLCPFIGDCLHQSPRNMCMYSLIMLMLSRTSLLFANSYNIMIIVAITLGIGKGVRSVYMSLVIPSHVTIERLPSAAGIQMVTNCICLLTFGPILGLIRDKSGSFIYCIIFINLLTLISVIIWLIEYLYLYLIREK